LLFQPNNDPDLQNDILWANDLGVRNLELARLYSDRPSLVFRWNQHCQPEMLPLERSLAADEPANGKATAAPADSEIKR
jgi:hypothetical protein